MRIEQIFFKNNLRNFSYLITFEDGAIFCIDPFRANEINELLDKKELSQFLKGIIITHDHCDHFSGLSEMLEKFKNESIDVCGHELAHFPGKTKSFNGGEVLYQQGIWKLKLVYTPGHTQTHLCVLLFKENIEYAIFTGDCLFNAGVGNCHNGGDPEVLFETIDKIFGDYPDDLLIYPGHEYLKNNLLFSNRYEENNQQVVQLLKEIEFKNLDEEFVLHDLGRERLINPFFRLESKKIRNNLKLESCSNKEVFLTLRSLRNKW